MEREKQFTKALEQIVTLAGEQGGCIEQAQVEEFLSELDLTEGQMDLVYDYLKKNRIGIGELVDPADYMSEEEIHYLDAYLEQLKDLPILSEGEKEAVTLSAMAGDKDAAGRLINAFLPEVAQIAKLYTGQGVLLEDLIGEGNVALTAGVTMLNAMEHAKEAQGMLVRMIMDAMEELIAENMADTDQEKKLADKVNLVADKANELAKELHRKVTVEELALETGMSRKSILKALKLSGDNIDAIGK